MARWGSKAFQLLEINIISGQDLKPIFKKMKTYARAWVNPTRKLSSCIDSDGNNNPTWNDKFVFRVDEEFLHEDKSAVIIEIYATHWLRDVVVGSVRVLVANLIPPPVLTRVRTNHHIGMCFVALQVRRPSGRPQGILNIGVALVDGSMRSMPLYNQLSASAVGFRDLMQNQNKKSNNNNQVKPILIRSWSEKSDGIAFNNSIIIGKNKGGPPKESSILSVSDIHPLKKKGKASSVIELREPKQKGNKSISVVSDSVYSKVSSRFYKTKKDRYEKPPNLGHGHRPMKGKSVWSDSEVGPSASEVAAAIAVERKGREGWSVDESVEGLRSKLERWRMELPQMYDNNASYTSTSSASRTRTRRRYYNNNNNNNNNGNGLFSCFGNICGYECQCVCGKPPPTRSRGY
ncbi:calcium-dependent lipid-binding family protein [Striga asiatica]|uniref:Calcium-dependent lipid-binding family protein n=1 Tax=Striga asiatica TaxID=4170 RepID=A0A5A7R1P7_STRAF|nr:calcium-dependent lipid-binding family protein [Striga asiatica]